ncbi:MAG: hypothetical protein AB7F43_11560 [Bacteriovoracia bacterium]
MKETKEMGKTFIFLLFFSISCLANDELVVFANAPEIAKKADSVLEKLLEAKSPAIQSWMAKDEQQNLNDSQIVKQWRIYYAKIFVIGQYPTPDSKVNTKIEKLMDKAFKAKYPDKKIKKFNQLFEKAKRLALLSIDNFSIPLRTKTTIKYTIQKINLYWMKSFKHSKFVKYPLELFSWGIAYDPGTKEINIGLDTDRYDSDETILAVFAHEIGHSFDPCRWSAFYEGKNPFQAVLDCLRSQKSVAARPRDDTYLDRFVKKGKLSKELALALRANPTCNKMEYPSEGIQADQILESFADWFSAEAISHHAHISKNLRSDLNSTVKQNAGSAYPSNEVRLSRIYFVNPRIRKILKLPKNEQFQYCELR